jgi:carbamoyl-phosphate synthase large subunit
MKSLRADSTLELLAADMDPWAAGLYLVAPPARTLVPPGADPGYPRALLRTCAELRVDILIPTCDAELEPLAAARDALAAAGTELLLAPAGALSLILDKLSLAGHCTGVVRVPRTEPFGADVDPRSWSYPVVVKPRRGSGSRGVVIVDSPAALDRIERSQKLMIQEYLPGQEYSIDVLADAGGRVLAAVPRVRERVDSGVSVAGRTVHDDQLEQFGRRVALATGLTYVANVQCKRDQSGCPALLEVNPRVPGTLGLTIASGVDMPRIAVDSLLGRPVPQRIRFREVAVVRFLDEVFLEPADILTPARGLPA